MSTPVRLLVADDHEAFRSGFCAALALVEGIDVVAEAADGAEAVRVAGELQPDVVVMDVNMPVLNGIDATRALTTQSPHIGVLVLTMYDDDESVRLAMRAGARGYLVKGASREQIVRAVTAVASGELILGAAAAGHLRRHLDGTAAPGPEPSPDALFPELTAREREVLQLMAAGRNNTEIARACGISAKTVRNHASNIFTKLMVTDRVHAVIKAREAGLVRE